MNRRQLLTRIPIAAVAVALAPVTALAVEPEFAEAVKLTELQICKMFRVPPHMVIGGTLTPNRVRAMENAWERHHIGIPSHPAYYVKFNTSALLRGDAQPHQA